MLSIFSRDRFGLPQIIAIIMLVGLLAQCTWFIAYVPLTQLEATYLRLGFDYMSGRGSGGDISRSPLTGLVASVPLRVLHPDSVDQIYNPFYLDQHRWLIRLPFLIAGVLLGGSLWYVARRLYGNTGGYIALGLYAFNPAVVSRMSMAQPEIIAAWGSFGAVFTAIAVAHTLYAPREVVLWNWRRILLLAFCILLMIGGQYSTAGILVLALLFMLWAVPERRGAAITIFLSACFVGFAFLFGAGFLLRPTAMFQSLTYANWFHVSSTLFSPLVYRMLGIYFLREAPAPAILFLIALGGYLAWKRPRFFGNTAPLLVFIVAIFLGLAMAGNVGYSLFFISVPFLILFSAGVFTDLLETRRASLVLGIAMGIVLTQAVTSFMGLAHLSRSSR